MAYAAPIALFGKKYSWGGVPGLWVATQCHCFVARAMVAKCTVLSSTHSYYRLVATGGSKPALGGGATAVAIKIWIAVHF